MERFILRYPGDPPAEVVKMTRGEFLAAYPRGPIVISFPGSVEPDEVYPMEPDQIQCDLCGADPGDTTYVLYGTRGYCPRCADEHIKPYCKEFV